ncbi:MAG: phage regulatory protein/antirepressor Ant [Prevotellaceae bacterium]|nr:phage regulatory protein/antirepressor Ant [Prevotellaceae bacterium]
MSEIVTKETVYLTPKRTPVTNSLLVAQIFGKKHQHVLEAIRKIRTAENSTVLHYDQWFAETSYTNSQGKQQPLVIMTKDGFTLLAMGFTGEKTMRFKVAFIEKFNEMEAELCRQATAEVKRFGLPMTRVEALRQLADAEERNERQQRMLEEQRPRVAFSKAVESSKSSMLLRDYACVLQQRGIPLGRNRLYKWLRQHGWLCTSGESRNRPTQRANDKGYFEVETRLIENPKGEVKPVWTTKITVKGQVYFFNLLSEEFGVA